VTGRDVTPITRCEGRNSDQLPPLGARCTWPSQTINAQDLASLIWDGSSPEQAAMTLRGYVMRLRRTVDRAKQSRIVLSCGTPGGVPDSLS
jgi:hypothetical protein